MRIDIIGIRTEEGADNQSGTWTEITTMTVTRNGIGTESGTITENYIRLKLQLRMNMAQKITID